MDEFFVTLKVLRDILEKKQTALLGILDICRTGDSPGGDFAAQKQEMIDCVLECDENFQSFWDKIKHDTDEKKNEYKDEIKALQSLINKVLELDIAVRAEELKNGRSSPLGKEPRAITPAFRNKVLDDLNKFKQVNKE
jgi:hypothetical protein